MPGGYTYRPATKRHIPARDNRTCQLCGAPAQVANTLISYGISMDSTQANLWALCRSCSERIRRERYDGSLPLADWYQAIEDCLTVRPKEAI